jgi:hypothetical protein
MPLLLLPFEEEGKDPGAAGVDLANEVAAVALSMCCLNSTNAGSIVEDGGVVPVAVEVDVGVTCSAAVDCVLKKTWFVAIVDGFNMEGKGAVYKVPFLRRRDS